MNVTNKFCENHNFPEPNSTELLSTQLLWLLNWGIFSKQLISLYGMALSLKIFTNCCGSDPT